MRNWLTGLLLAMVPFWCYAAWVPPPKPDCMVIEQSARSDVREGRYDDALDKLNWLYDHSLEIAPGFRGVRNSFLLDIWRDLGTRYPPAMAGLRAQLDRAVAEVRGSHDDCKCAQRFDDISSISRVLKEWTQLRESFFWLDANRPKVAATACARELPELAAAEAAWPCEKYVESDALMRDYVGEYRQMLASDSRNPREKQVMERVSREMFSHQAAVLVALLAHGRRQAEADAAAGRALQELGTGGDRPSGVLEQARKGRMPASPPEF